MKFRDLHPNIQIRIIQNFMGGIVGNMIFPFLGIYFSAALGPKATGLLVIISIIVSVSVGVFGGHFADRYGRKMVKFYAETLRFFAFTGVAFANSPWYHSSLVTFLLLLVVSVCDGLSFPASEAMLIDVSTPETRTMIYSIDYWSSNFSLVVGGIIGGFLFQSHSFSLFVTMSIVSLLSLLLLVFFIKETRPNLQQSATSAVDNVSTEQQSMFKSYAKVFSDRPFLLFLLAAMLGGALEQMANNYTRIRLAHDFHPQLLFSFTGFSLPVDGVNLYAILNSENALMVVLFSVLVRRLVQKANNRVGLLLGVFLNMAGYAAMAVNNVPWMLFAFMMIAVIGELAFVPVKQTFVANMAPTENRGVYMAVNGLSGVGSGMIGGLSITAGAFLNMWWMGLVFVVLGMGSILLYQNVISKIEKRGHAVEQKVSISGSA